MMTSINKVCFYKICVLCNVCLLQEKLVFFFFLAMCLFYFFLVNHSNLANHPNTCTK